MDPNSGIKAIEVKRPAVTAAPPANVAVPAVAKVEDLNAMPAKDLYLKARDYFVAGNYGSAIQLAALAKSKTPTAILPVILMAQCYYRMGNNSKAEALFRSVEIGDILPEAAVDYAFSMFAARRYREVIKIYPVVPVGHPYKDIVKFYVGVAYVNFEQYDHAMKYLRKAGNLPSNLNAQRRRILSEMDDLRDRERGRPAARYQQLSQQNWSQSYVVPPPIPAEILPGGTPGGATAAKAPPAPPPALAKSSTSFSATPLLKLAMDSSKTDFSGVFQSHADSKTTGGEMALGAKFLGRAKSFGSQPSLDLNLTPSYSHTDRNSTTSKLTASVDDPANVQNNITAASGSTFFLNYTYGLNGLYPVSEPVDLGGGYLIVDSHSDARIDSTMSTPSLKAVVEVGNIKIDGNWSQAQYTEKKTHAKDNASTTLKLGLKLSGDNSTTTGSIESKDNSKPLVSGVKSTLTLAGSWLTNFEDISLGIAATKTDVTRLPKFLKNTALKQWTASATGTYLLPFELSVELLGAYTSLSNVVVQLDKGADGVVPESLGTMTGKQLKISLSGKIAGFLSLKGSYSYETRTPVIDDPAFEKELLKNNFSENTSTSLSLAVSQSF